MAYVPPTFNQECFIEYRVLAGDTPTVVGTFCQVRGISKVRAVVPEVGTGISPWATNVLIAFPSRSPVYGQGRDAWACQVTVGSDDLVTYTVLNVWDVAQGFPNEYRMAACLRTSPLPGQ